MAAATNDVLAGKEPVPPTEAADVLEKSQVQDSSTSILATVVPNANLCGSLLNVFQELAVWLWAIASEVFQDARERVLRHGNLQQIIQQRDNRVVSPRLPAERHGLSVVLALVDHAVREHGLIGDAKDEGAVLGMVLKEISDLARCPAGH